MSTPSEPRQPHDDEALEPIRVLRPRRTDALAELFREFTQDTQGRTPGAGPVRHESFAVPAPRPGSEDTTKELPPVRGRTRPRAQGTTTRRAAVAIAVCAAAVLGFGSALLLLGRSDTGGDRAAPAPQPPAVSPTPTVPAASAPVAPSAPASSAPAPSTPPPASAPAAAPDAAGTLREGDTGPEVTELQQRLLRVPNVYQDGSADGRYDATLTAAVARFQLWYGVRGDETGVYGDDTRLALESRTAPIG
ncbi:peptidoglycan-binding domain-containing protein [Streptomyces sp. NPDC052682]|uniref:peptidoglycan-binding domain-containing protein n=1 Tax=Streptomyces sp. NPDC052682 TaxID=3154954 RepID=UPI003438A51B